MDDSRKVIADILKNIQPFDEKEASHRQDAIDWVTSGAPLYRIQKPDVPPKHLVSYFIIYDPDARKILLQDHLLAGLWLPAGGHVDLDEDPAETVRRECVEELGIEAMFLNNPRPLFVTVTKTVGQGYHTDVSLWYMLRESESTPLTIEPNRFADVRWWGVDEILATPIEKFDPELHRFINKMKQVIW